MMAMSPLRPLGIRLGNTPNGLAGWTDRARSRAQYWPALSFSYADATNDETTTAASVGMIRFIFYYPLVGNLQIIVYRI
tara:strand:- start:878 stop:1114 length:237 start_codon:yes stop_codon:yes gene_type:complete